MRIPISLVRRSTEYAVTPYSPIDARINARKPNSEVSFAIMACWLKLFSTCAPKLMKSITARS